MQRVLRVATGETKEFRLQEDAKYKGENSYHVLVQHGNLFLRTCVPLCNILQLGRLFEQQNQQAMLFRFFILSCTAKQFVPIKKYKCSLWCFEERLFKIRRLVLM